MKFTQNEIRVGLFLVIPVGILIIFIILKLGYSIAGSTMDVFLKTDSLTSVKQGTPIKMKGYPIGRVVEIKPVYKPALHFLATMRINRDVEIYEDCTAIIQNQNVIGDPVIEFRNPEMKGKPLLDNDVIEGFEVVSLDSVLANVNTLLTTVTGTVSSIKNIATDSSGNLKATLGNLSGSMASLNAILESSQKDIGSILASFRETAKVMNEISVELKKHPVRFLFKGKD